MVASFSYFNPATGMWSTGPPPPPPRPVLNFVAPSIGLVEKTAAQMEAQAAQDQAEMFPAAKPSLTPRVALVDTPMPPPPAVTVYRPASSGSSLSPLLDKLIPETPSGNTGIGGYTKEVAAAVAADEKKNADMSFLGIDLAGVVKKIAPKIVEATITGGTADEKALLKTALQSPVFDPVFEKFGKDFETGAKIASVVATAGLGLANLGDGKSKSDGPFSNPVLNNLLPSSKEKTMGGILNEAFDGLKNIFGSSGGQSGGGVSTYVIIGGVILLLFWKKIKRLLKF